MPNTDNALNVNFNNGNVNNNNKTNDNYVRPVRGGTCKKEGVFSFSNVYRCYRKCLKRKRNTLNAIKYEMNLEENICKLEQELKEKTYRPAPSACFVTKKPKLREIFAAEFNDRIVHHILIDYLERIYEPIFIYNSYACRKNKGNHAAVRRLGKFLREITKNNTVKAYYLQLDIKSFFINIDKKILFDLIKKRTAHPNILWLLEVILFHDCVESYVIKGDPELFDRLPPHKTLFNAPEGKGLPIGNLTSQFFANVYLNELDMLVKHGLKCRYYVRYADDFILLSVSRRKLLEWRERIEKFLNNKLLLELNKKEEKLKEVSAGIDFLGYITRPKYTLVRNRVVNNCREKLRELEKQVVETKHGMKIIIFNPDKVKRTVDITASYLAHFKHADAYKLKKSILERFEFIEEFIKYRRLTVPRYFTSMKKQVSFFKNILMAPEYRTDKLGQVYFEYPKTVIYFQIGKFYIKEKFPETAPDKECSIYIVRQVNEFTFNNRLKTRILSEKYRRKKE